MLALYENAVLTMEQRESSSLIIKTIEETFNQTFKRESMITKG